MSVSTAIGLFQGEAATIADQIFQSDGTTPYDVTNWTLRWTLRYSSGDASPVEIVKDNVGIGGITPVVLVQGKIAINLTAADTKNLPAGLHYWTVDRTDTGAEATLSDGILVLKQRMRSFP